MPDKNQKDWNDNAAKYSAMFHTDKAIRRVLDNPSCAFYPVIWEMISTFFPDLQHKRICVPSSGDNMAVFAFAALGAEVTSCDFAENQLKNAERIARNYGIAGAITFCREDTMRLDGIDSEEYDFVYTSNGVCVWIDDLRGMFRNIRRILNPGGAYIMFEIHPFQRPFDDTAKIIKPYGATGPFEDEYTVNYHWRLSDLLNAQTDAGLTVRKIEEMDAEVNYDDPFWIGLEQKMQGVTATREEIDRMHDWRHNPLAALPNWLGVAATRE